MRVEIHNEIQSTTPTDQYKPIELNDYVFMKKLNQKNNKRVYNSPLYFKRMRERKSEIKNDVQV